MTQRHAENSRSKVQDSSEEEGVIFKVSEVNASEDTSEELNAKKFDKIVLITTPEYSVYMENLVSSKVSVFCVTTGNLNNVASAVKCRRKFEPGKTLWLTHPEVFRIDRTEKSDMCTACEEPLEIYVLPSMERMTYSNYANEIQSSFDELIKKVNSFLNAESSFAILPPFPPAFLPLEDTEHDRYHKIDKGRKTYYFTTSSALIGFESLYTELSKRMIPFSFAELKKMNIQSSSIAEYFKVVDCWNSCVHVETHTDELRSEEHTNAKFSQWFKHINQLFSDTLKSSYDDTDSIRLTSEKKNTESKPVALKDSCISSEIRDDISDILGEILEDELTFAENSEPEIITLDSPSETEELIISENYDHIVFICFCRAHAQLVREQRTKDISVVVVKSTLNWCEEKEKFDIFAQIYKTVLFIVIGSINLLGKENCIAFCEREYCIDPFICLDLCSFSFRDIVNIAMQKYKKFMNNLRDYFKKVTSRFMFTSILPVKCTLKPSINESTHEGLHKLLTNNSVYFLKRGKKRWSIMANNFQTYDYIKMLEQGHELNREEVLNNIITEIKEPSKSPICWVELDEIAGTESSDYNEKELRLLFQKIIDATCPEKKRKRKNTKFLPPQNINIDANVDNSPSQQKRKRMTLIDNEKVNYVVSASNSEFLNASSTPQLEYNLFCGVTGSSLDMEKEMDSEIPQQTSESSKKRKTCHLKILLESKVADEVFGDNGETLQKLQKDTNSKILISKEGEFFPGTSERVCLIAGTAEAVFNSLAFIIDIKRTKSLCGIEMQMEFVVPDSTAKLIFDDGEENIRLIKMKSKVFMRMYNKNDYPSPDETCFVVRSIGDDFIKTAFSVILEHIALDPDNGSCSNVAYSDVNVPASNSKQDSSLSRREEIVDSKISRLMQDNSKENKMCHLKILFKSDFIKAVIGDNGETLQKLQKDTKSIVTISGEYEYYPGTTERFCSITGTIVEGLKALVFFIIDIAKVSTPRGSEVKMEFAVLDTTAKLIIGEREENIQQIKTKSKAYMRMYNKKNYPSPDESCFVVRSYDVKYIKTAFSLILESIVPDPENGRRINETSSDANFSTSSGNKALKNRDSPWLLKKESANLETPQMTPEICKKNNFCKIKILLENVVAGRVNKTDGETRRKLEKDTNSRIKISKKSKYFPGTSLRACSIVGTAEAVLKVICFVIDCKRSVFPHESEIKMKFAVLDSTARLIIGEDNIQQIMIKSKAYIQIYQKKDYPSPNESCFTVNSYDVEFIKTAFSLILECIVRDPGNITHSDMNNPKANLSSSSVYEALNNNAGSSHAKSSSTAAYEEILNSHSQNYGYQMNEGHINHAGGSSYYNYEYPVKILRSSSRNEDDLPHSPHKRSRNRSRSRSRNYRSKRSRLHSGSGSDSGSREYRSSYRKDSPSKIYDRSIHHDNKIDHEFSVIDALNLLERVCVKYGVFSEMIKSFTTIIKSELKIDRSKALRLIKDDNILLEMIVNKLKSCIASTPSEEMMLLKAIEWTTYLIEYVEKTENPERNITLRAINSRSRSDSRNVECQSRYRRNSPSRTDDKFTHRNSNNIGQEFSVSGALNLLERVCDKCEVLSGLIKFFTTSVKSELKIDRSKALKLIEEDNNILLLRMTVNKLESCIASAPLEEIGILSKAVEWTNYLIEYVGKGENPEKNMNLKSITYSKSRSRTRRSRSDSREREWHSKYRSNPAKSDDKSNNFDRKKIGDEFSVIGALNLLERVREKRGALSEMIMAFTTTIRSELEVDRNKALRLIKDDNNILLGMIVNELKSRIASAPLEDIEMLSKAVQWTKCLKECAERAEKPARDINFMAIAKGSLNKSPYFIVNLIKSSFLYELKLNPSTEDINEAFVKISSLQSKMVLDYI